MAVFSKIASGCALALALLGQAGLAAAASNSPKIAIPPSTTNSVICDSRGCFGFGQRQFYTRPGQPLPITPPYTGGVKRFDSPRVQMPPRETYAPPPRALYPSPAQKLRQHQTWCAERYRTYNPGTNRYTTINRGTQPCRSPFD
ncbi:BA14K family protein [Agrobacterium rhizogenes]|nr:BA14K family protein [Rhizobium rhizogenes]NTJ81814.1 BA14K family protein [Rhizobium rhizogenes]